MENRGVFTKILAIAGTELVWFLILATFLSAADPIIAVYIFPFDRLMPAELFPVALPGGCLLLWAALRARLRRRLVGWSLGIAVGSLAIGQVVAIVTGLASGRTGLVGWPWTLVLALLGIYALALIVMDVGGLLLLRDLFRAPRRQHEQV